MKSHHYKRCCFFCLLDSRPFVMPNLSFLHYYYYSNVRKSARANRTFKRRPVFSLTAIAIG